MYSITAQIVFTQMTKTDMFAGRASWDHIADLDIAVFDDHAIDEQFRQFSFLLKVGIFQAVLDTAAKLLNGRCQTRQLILPIDLLGKLLFLLLHSLMLAIQVCSPALIFRQWDRAIQVGCGQAVELVL